MTGGNPPKPNSIKVGNQFERVKRMENTNSSAWSAKQKGRPRNGEDERREPFLNPYSFVPAFSRERVTGAFADDVPEGADCLHEKNWTGTIGVRLTVRTPLLLLDTARAEDHEGHLTYPVLQRNDRPHLPATAVKGMLRAAYEAITNSRFGVFAGHSEPLGWRRIVDDARDMRPVRVSADGKLLELWHPVKLSRYRGNPGPVYPGGEAPKDGDHIWVDVVRGQNADEVNGIRLHKYGSPGPGWEEGYAFITGRTVDTKKDERVFVHRGTETKELTKELRARWETLMEHYRKLERNVETGGVLDISPHRNTEGRRKLTPGMFCWAYMPTDAIEALYPIMIPREVAIKSPDAMVPPKVGPAFRYRELSPADRVFGWVAQGGGSGTRPAAYRGRLRISEVTCVTPTAKAVVRFPGRGLPLAILGQPKPTQGRFYLSRSAAEPHRPIDQRTSKNDVHRSPDRALRGRKVYWHHQRAAANDDYWNPHSPPKGGDPTQQPIDDVLYREYVRPNAPSEGNGLTHDKAAFETTGEPQRDKQNRSIRGWICKDTEFTFNIDVRDVPAAELGALLWLLDLDDDCHHRLGLGKPLGFGSVHLTLDPKRMKLHTGAQWSQYYRDLAGELPEWSAESAESVKLTFLQAFEEATQSLPGFAKIRLAFLAAARGRDDLPVHYPRTRPKGMQAQRTPPNPAGESFAWFSANERATKGNVVRGRGRSLPAAGDPQGRDLDVYPHEK